jgi:STAM-binding protein
MALSRHHASITRPLNVQEIVTQAQDFDFSTERDLRAWLRAARMLLTEAAICEQDGNLQMAYLYLYRHAELIISKIPTHPNAKDPKFKADLNLARKTVNKNLVKLEQWKPRIVQQHQRYAKAMERRNAEKQRIYDEQRDGGSLDPGASLRRPSLGFPADEEAYHDLAEALDARENSQLAVDLAQNELRRRDINRQTTRQAGVSPGTVASRRQGLVMDVEDPYEPNDARKTEADRVSEGIKEAGSYLHKRGQESRDARMHNFTGQQRYQYPTVPAKEGTMSWDSTALQPRDSRLSYDQPPAVPAKDGARADAPPVPEKYNNNKDSPAAVQKTASQVTFKPNAFTEGGAPLRTVFLPPTLRTTFLNRAHANTSRNLETCGILCGTVISNALFISHLVIPDQTSTSDTCDTTEEGDNELFDFCDGNDLLVCGWIHTHPSQSCFLSSRDLHTSSGYQVMLPEAIAIVCAPRQNPDWGIFRLTDPPGLPAVLNCHQKGLFHPHSEDNLYTDALRPGHVVEGPGLKFQTVDLRKA